MIEEGHYKSLVPLYEKLTLNTLQELKTLLDTESISIFDVTSRVKTWKSFSEKVQRKKVVNPFEDIEDIGGIRIISYYTSDIPRIIGLVGSEFNVLTKEDKADQLQNDRFGYRSFHFVVTIKERWASTPTFRGLTNLKMEIQIRTILMHAWAAFNHKFSYKKETDVDPRFLRRINRLSALVELADEQFDQLQHDRSLFRDSLISTSSGKGAFDNVQPLNIDTLQALLDFHYPDKEKLQTDASDLLDEVREHGLTLSDLNQGLLTYMEAIGEMESEEFKTPSGRTRNKRGWSQGGVARTLMELISESYWADRKNDLDEKYLVVTKKWRHKLGLVP